MQTKLLVSVVALSAALFSTWVVAEEKKEEAAKAEAVKTEVVVEAKDEKKAEEPAKEKTTEDTLKDKLIPLFGSAPDKIETTPVKGVYAVSIGMEMIYVSEDGRYFFVNGDLIDGETRMNLTENARSGARKSEMEKADKETAITFKAKGKERFRIAVFTDVSCPFCVKLHQEVPKLNEEGVTVDYYAYPRAGVDSGAYKSMVNAWCAEDKVDAMSRLKGGENLDVKDCKNPVADHFALGRKVGVTGTPAIITQDGLMIPGYRPAAQLVQALEDAQGS